MRPLRHRWIAMLPWATGALVLAQLLSLRLGLLDRFFYDAMHAEVQGIDYYSLPRAFLSLAAGRSAYDTFGPPVYGPHYTWYLAHPALAPVLGSWLSLFEPTTGYGVYTLLSLGMMAACAWLLARQSDDPLHRRLIWLLLLGAFPSYWMLFVGNVQALLVLALGLLFAGLLQLARKRGGEASVFTGLLLSLLTKPLAALMLPLLLLIRQTRRAACRALAVYVLVSVLFETVPGLNPEAIGLSQVAWLVLHPQTVRDTMNIYANHIHVTPWMKDNSIHWLNLVAQSCTRMRHVDIFSLPVFLDTVFNSHTPDWPYRLPLLLVLALSVAVARTKDETQRMEKALLLAMAASLVFFLSYPTVWEYQYTGVLPVAAALLLLREGTGAASRVQSWMLALAACAWLPSLYFLTEGRDLTAATLTLIRLDRVVPVTLLFLLLCFEVGRTTLYSPAKAELGG